jgi:HAD superfamily hydrolase (TIGR01549 family)
MGSSEWSETTKRFVVVGLVIVLLLVLYFFRSLLPPIAVAAVLAYLLKPVADFLERRTRMSRVLAVILVFIALLLVISTIPATVVPYLVDRVTRLNLDLQQLADDLVRFLSRPVTVAGFAFDPRDLMGDVRTALQNLLRPFATQTVGFLLNVASSLLWIISVLIISFYLVKDADKLRAYLDSVAPPGHVEELRSLREAISQVWSAFLRGQLVLSVAIGVVVWLSMMAVGLPNAGLMGLVAGLLEVIPTFGPVLSVIPALLLAFFRGSTYLPISNFWFAVLVLGIYLLIQQTENAYFVPRIMGRRLHLHPVVVFIGVLAGGLMAGAIGVLLAAPVIATLRVASGYVYAKLLDRAPFPSEEVLPELYPGEIDAILFDLDGTLVETDDDAVEALARRLGVVRWILPKRDSVRAARQILMAVEAPANRTLGLLDRLGLDDNLFGVANRLRRMRGVHAPVDYRVMDGVAAMLSDLSRRYYLAIVTTRCHRDAADFLANENLTDAFQVITGRDDTWRLKPHPSPVRHAAEELGVPVHRCLMVGDTTVDIRAAQAAGARSVGVLCGFGDRQDLERAGADQIIECTTDLLNWM